MPYTVAWYYEPRVILSRFYGAISTEDVLESNAKARELIHAGTLPIYVIVNTLEVNNAPFTVRTLKDSVTFTKEPNLAGLVVISNNVIFSFFGTVAGAVGSKQFHIVHSLDDALAVVARLDTTLAGNLAARS